jgi:hypothetical protein
MAKEQEDQDRKLISEEVTTNIVFDSEGHQESATDFSVKAYESSDGETDYTKTIAEHQITSDNTIVAAGLGFRPESQGGVVMRRCDGCVDETRTFLHWLLYRDRPRITWSPAKNMRRCFDSNCRKSLCERHYVLSSDKHLRCQKCNKHFQIKQRAIAVLRFLFLRKV